MQSDTIKLLTTYAMASVVIVGGGAMLFISRSEANTDFQLIISSLIGAAVTFLFGAESATRAVRSYQQGQSVASDTTVKPDTETVP
jgi:hypothetical protein